MNPGAGGSRGSTRGPAWLLGDVLFVWMLWVVLVTALAGRTLADAGPYLTFPILLFGGFLIGGLAGRRVGGTMLWATGSLGGRGVLDQGVGPAETSGVGNRLRQARARQAAVAVLVQVVLLAALAVLLARRDFYANAQAASGVQILAASGLLLTSALRIGSGVLGRPSRALLLAGAIPLAGLAGTLGATLALRAQAGLVLAALLLAVIVLALVVPSALPRQLSILTGIGVVGGALAAVVGLTLLPEWPLWLGDDRSLSSTRHLLWRDALSLWREHPIFGGGPGSFYDSSAIARSATHLYSAHSSVLQVGAELGTPGVLLFLAVVVLAALVAARSSRHCALIGVAAWSALAVHSMIDHLFEFPVVVLLAGIVIGLAGAGSRSVALTSRPPPLSGAEGPSDGSPSNGAQPSGTFAP